jgi:excinuclease ABC subunit C
LLRHFGSLRKLRAASIEQIIEVPGVGRRTAEAVLAALANGSAPGGTGTGSVERGTDKTGV